MPLRSLPALVPHPIIRFMADTMVCLRFFTRLPIPILPFEPAVWNAETFGPALRAAPLAGLLIGGIGTLLLCLGVGLLRLPHLLAATLALTAQIAASGGLHEDGLADVADGFGGGSTPQRKLDIMRDSRLGTFGVLAVGVSMLVRVSALAALLDRYGVLATAAGFTAAAAASRGFALLPLAMLPPARRDGLSHSAGMLPPANLGTAMAIAVFLGTTLAVSGGFGETRALGACTAALAAAAIMTHIAFRQIGGQTGDVAGAAQQLSEIAYLVALLVAPGLG